MNKIFTGLSAFPLTPLRDDRVDEEAFIGLIRRLAGAGVDSITALGSTGSYAYLTREERARVAQLAVEHAGTTPVFIGVGALRTSEVLANIDAAEEAGAAGVLLAPMTYQPLTDDDVLELFRTVTRHTDLPVIVYDNPNTTHFRFSVELYEGIGKLEGIAAIKVPGVPTEDIRAVIPEHISIGVSGDAFAAEGLKAGCDMWYSVIGGTLPGPALAIARGDYAEAQRLQPLWDLFAEFGSLRATAAIAEYLGLVPEHCLPLPIQGLNNAQRQRTIDVVEKLNLS